LKNLFLLLCIVQVSQAMKVDNEKLLEVMSTNKSASSNEREKQIAPKRMLSINKSGKEIERIQSAAEYLKLGNRKYLIKKVIRKNREIRNTLKEMDNLIISQYVKNEKMQDMDSINMSSNLPQIIMLPPSATITDVYVYPDTLRAHYQFNRVDLEPSSAFEKTSVVITYVEGNIIKVFNLFVNKAQNDKKTWIYPTIAYEYEEVLSVSTVLKRFHELHKHYPRHGSMIQINRTQYIFYKDKINGYIDFGKGLYRLEIQHFNYK